MTVSNFHPCFLVTLASLVYLFVLYFVSEQYIFCTTSCFQSLFLLHLYQSPFIIHSPCIICYPAFCFCFLSRIPELISCTHHSIFLLLSVLVTLTQLSCPTPCTKALSCMFFNTMNQFCIVNLNYCCKFCKESSNFQQPGLFVVLHLLSCSVLA